VNRELTRLRHPAVDSDDIARARAELDGSRPGEPLKHLANRIAGWIANGERPLRQPGGALPTEVGA